MKPTNTLRPITVCMLAALAPAAAHADYNGKSWLEVEAQVSSILDNMSAQEKYQFIRVDDGHMIPRLDRFGIEGTVAYDSTLGVHVNNTTFGASYPSQTALAATWNIKRAQEQGLALGYETRMAGGEQMLSPVVNLYRTPLNGRAAESVCGEDPFLCSVMAPAITNGIQAQGIQAGAKHLIANEQEANRHALDVHVDERTLREMYLVPFESLVKNADIASIMCGFNKVNGDFACENHHIIKEVLKDEWGYQGFVMSDFNAIQNAYEGAYAGTDLDMPSGLQFTQDKLQPYVDNGTLAQSVIDDKVARNLRALIRYGLDKGGYPAQTLDYPEYGLTASLDTAREGIVLLKNDASGNQGALLPLNKSARIAVVGNGAQLAPSSPFGTGYSDAESDYVSELSGLQQLATNSENVTFIKSMSLSPEQSLWLSPDCQASDDTCRVGVEAEYFANTQWSGEPVLTREEQGINFSWTNMTNVVENACIENDAQTIEEQGLDCSSVTAEQADGSRALNDLSPSMGGFSARFTTSIKPTITGKHVFKVRADGPVKLWVNGKLLLESDGEPRAPDVPNANPLSVQTPRLKAGQTYQVVLEYAREQFFQGQLGGLNGVQLSWASLTPPADLSDYDAVVAVVGRSHEYEGEASDPNFELPEQQATLLTNLMRSNRNTIVVMHGGGGMDMQPWNKKAKAILHAWFSGQLGGQALAEILYGDVNPSGKLPITLDSKLKYNPSYPSYSNPDDYIGENAKTDMTYSEGLFFGYRGYDISHHKPLYPFGFGLSYTTFNFSNLTLSDQTVTENGTLYANFTVTNTGSQAGYETAQLYVHPQSSSVERPQHELKGFSKIYLQAGESKQVSIPLNARSFAHYDIKQAQWEVEAGRYTIEIGDSSDSLPLSSSVNAHQNITLDSKNSNPLPGPVQFMVQVDKSEAYAY